MKRFSDRFKFISVASLTIWSYAIVSCFSQEPVQLEQRIRQGDRKAILEAGEKGMRELVPMLEQIVAGSASPLESHQRAARMALAKMGVQKYLQQAIQEVEDSTNSEIYIYFRSKYSETAEVAAWKAKMHGIGALVYVGDKSAIRAIASLLFVKPSVTAPSSTSDAPLGSSAFMAAMALSKMNLPNSPNIREMRHPSGQDIIDAWKKWWAEHKDYYEKPEFGQPAPSVTPAVKTNAVPIPVVVAPK